MSAFKAAGLGLNKTWDQRSLDLTQSILADGVSDRYNLYASTGRPDQLTFPQEFCQIVVLKIPDITIWLHLISGHFNDYLQ